MCDTFHSISQGKCARPSNRCVLWVLNHKIIKRHLTIRGIHSNIAPRHLSGTLHNAAALIESPQRASHNNRYERNPLVFIMQIEDPLWEDSQFINQAQQYSSKRDNEHCETFINLYLRRRTCSFDRSQHTLWYSSFVSHIF